MSRIQELKKEKCPNGVEYKKLGECVKTLKKGTLKTSELNKQGYPVINSGRGLYGYYNDFNNVGPAFTIAARGEYAGFINFFNQNFWAGGLCYPYKSLDEENISTKFIYYYLKNIEKKVRKEIVSDGSIPALNKRDVEKIKIPIPPIEVQSQIVNILDKFVELEAELEAELESELEARKKQYEFYRSVLINKKGYHKKLKDIAYYSKDRVGYEELNENNYISVENLLQNKMGKIMASYVPCKGNSTKYIKGDILVGNIRPYLKKIWLSDNCGGTNGDVLDIRIKNKNVVIPQYLYYVLSSEDFFEYNSKNSKGAKMPRGDKKIIMEYEICLSSLEEQKKIVKILDKFDKLVNDVKEGLPAEIECRRKQYEYYRNKLLSFSELKVS